MLKPEDRPLAFVVEDDPDLRRMVVKYLGLSGFRVEESGNGRHAVQWLSRFSPQLVVLDLMLPEQSGFEICEVIRRDVRLARVPVLVISARALPEDRASAEEVGASAYLIKPFTHKDFSAAVERVLKLR
jgi:two-component system chemotaxis response regulator CheY